jgi:hypothetical protein
VELTKIMEEINMSNGSSLRARGAATEVINLAAGTGAVAARTGAAGLLQSQVRSQSPQFQTEDLFDDKDDGSGGGDDDDGDADADDDPEVNYRDPPEGYLRLRPSQFNHIPATVFVEYPPELGLTRKDLSSLEKLGRRKLHYICYWGRNCVKNAFRSLFKSLFNLFFSTLVHFFSYLLSLAMIGELDSLITPLIGQLLGRNINLLKSSTTSTVFKKSIISLAAGQSPYFHSLPPLPGFTRLCTAVGALVGRIG